METIFESDFAALTYERELSVLIITWKDKKLNMEEYQRPFKIALDFMSKNPVDNYISDIRKQGIVSPDFRKWLQESALPEAAQAGLKRIAGVANVNVFKQSLYQ